MTRLAVFASGRGSNLTHILAACETGIIAGTVGLVVTNEPLAGAVAVARDARVPVLIADHRDYVGRIAHEQAIAAVLQDHEIELVVLAGYMRVLSPFLLGYLYDPQLRRSRVINIHPADPLHYRGADGYGWAIATKQAEMAVAVHFVDEGVDTGQIIVLERLPIVPGESLESLRSRGQALEHRLYPAAIQRVIHRLRNLEPCAAF